MDDDDPPGPGPLPRQEALELLALGEVIARKAAYGRQLTGGQSWLSRWLPSRLS
jgi:hypothetical protein